MATSNEAGGLSPFKAIGSLASDTGDAVITGAPGSLVAVAIEAADGSILVGAESGTTVGTYTFSRSGTTASAVIYFIL